MIYDVIIIGAGPAGITAAVYAARKKMTLLVITKDIGGQAALTNDIQNYTGYQFITGQEFAVKFEEHIKKYKIAVKENEKVLRVEKKEDRVCVKTEKAIREARTAIIATGAQWRKLNVPGEKEFKNRGVSYCATCDGPIFQGKDVAIIGGGNSGLHAALQLEKIAKQVYLIEATGKLTGDEIMQEKLRKSSKITIFTNTRVKSITGEKMVSGISITTNNNEEQLKVQGVFVEAGLIPSADFENNVEKNKKGEIKINSSNETNIPGIFAAGDVTDVPEKQIIIAAGEGAKTALSVFRYIAHR